MDFYHISERLKSTGRGANQKTVVEIYPEFLVARATDIMVQGNSFVAIWDEKAGLWNTDEYSVPELVDREMEAYVAHNRERLGDNVRIRRMSNFSSNSWVDFKRWLSKVADNAHTLNQKLVFDGDPVRKEDYASVRLPYSLSDDEPTAWKTLVGKLYAEEERTKIEWAIGSIVTGDYVNLHKFLVLYGAKGTGKSTVINIIQDLFKGYYQSFDAKALGQSSNQFSTEIFKKAPMVAIQHDGDLSRIEDNTKLNSIVSHEEMIINEKHKSLYSVALNTFLFMGTNHPVKITDAKSGIIRRLIDVMPTGDLFEADEYDALMTDIQSEHGAIAKYCADKYRKLGRNYYRDYIPLAMMLKTDVFMNFIEHMRLDLENNDPITLKRAWELYKNYQDEARMEHSLPMYKFREALKDYYKSYEERALIDGERMRQVYSGFRVDKLSQGTMKEKPGKPYSLVLDQTTSLLDDDLKDCPAQYSSSKGTPKVAWDDVTSTLKDLSTTEEHYVRPPLNHIVIDFDLKDETGEKSTELNMAAASKLPPTYAEFSKGGHGIHLHYIYDGDPEKLSAVYDDNVEIKVFKGKSSLRRRVSYCNNIPVAHISEGLPLKGTKVINHDYVTTDKSLRTSVEKALRKEVHGSTKPNVDFIAHILDEAYEQGVQYDLSDLRQRVLAFCLGSTHQSDICVKTYSNMKFVGQNMDPELLETQDIGFPTGSMVFFDVEVYPNLFLVCYKKAGKDASVVKMVNPTPEDIEAFVEMPLVGFNNRRYDNHILYARWMGASNEELFKQSKRIIDNVDGARFASAYNLSYTDVYDFAATKQSLKKWEIELGLKHMEMDIPWDKPVPDDKLDKVIEYCANDVRATEAVFEHLEADWHARELLSQLSGLTVNASTNAHTQQIIFGDEKKPTFYHTDLSETFPGYSYEYGKSMYRGEDVGDGGYVYSEPGIYNNVALLDVASMHPASLIAMDCFGEQYTKVFRDIRDARIAVKHRDRDAAEKLLDGKLLPYFSDDDYAMDALAFALKIVINSVYGLTAANFATRCNGNDPANNPDNIVAKRGALFMVDLKHYVQEQGFTVAHIKTDSIKIPEATPDIIEKVIAFGKKYGYDFEHEATYDRMALVNKSTYIAKYEGPGGQWTATGAQFAHQVVFKSLFTHEKIDIWDYVETRQVNTSIGIDYGDGSKPEFVGRIGTFVPVIPNDEVHGGILLREKDGEYKDAVNGTKGYLWQLADRVVPVDGSAIDTRYSRELVDEAKAAIQEFGDFEVFAS